MAEVNGVLVEALGPIGCKTERNKYVLLPERERRQHIDARHFRSTLMAAPLEVARAEFISKTVLVAVPLGAQPEECEWSGLWVMGFDSQYVDFIQPQPLPLFKPKR